MNNPERTARNFYANAMTMCTASQKKKKKSY